MAIVKGPLMSIDARGAIAKTLVFLGWKGLKDVREYKVPSNPNTAGQQSIRGKMTAAVAAWHNIGFNLADKTAWDFKASLSKKPLSGFNQMVSEYIAAYVAVHVITVLKVITAGTIISTGFHALGTGVGTQAYKVWVGTNPRALLTSFSGSATGGAIDITVTGLSASTVYYFKITCETASDDTESGIYKVTTPA